jgi:hypothetical protein
MTDRTTILKRFDSIKNILLFFYKNIYAITYTVFASYKVSVHASSVFLSGQNDVRRNDVRRKDVRQTYVVPAWVGPSFQSLTFFRFRISGSRRTARFRARPGSDLRRRRRRLPPPSRQTPGTDFTKLHFGRKFFLYYFILKLGTNFHPKTTDETFIRVLWTIALGFKLFQWPLLCTNLTKVVFYP